MVQYGIENGERRKSTANVLTVLGCANARYLKDNDGAESEYSLLLQYLNSDKPKTPEGHSRRNLVVNYDGL